MVNFVDPPPAAQLPSGQDLLDEFVRYGRQRPFEEIVRRYAGMVYNTCLRVTKDKHDAEDAAQAVFLTLALQVKKGAEIKALGPWLQQVAKRLSLDLRRGKKRRNGRELRHHEQETWHRRCSDEDSLPLADLDEMKAVLHDELQRLPSKYRLPLILHYFGGLSRDEMAAELNCNTSTLGVRIFRGRALLAERLRGRGMNFNPILLPLMLGVAVRGTISQAMVAATSRAAAAVAAGHDGVGLVSSRVIRLTRRAAAAAFFGKLKIAGLALLVVSTLMTAGARAMGVLPHINIQSIVVQQVQRLVRPLLQPLSVPRIEATGPWLVKPWTTPLGSPFHVVRPSRHARVQAPPLADGWAIVPLAPTVVLPELINTPSVTNDPWHIGGFIDATPRVAHQHGATLSTDDKPLQLAIVPPAAADDGDDDDADTIDADPTLADTVDPSSVTGGGGGGGGGGFSLTVPDRPVTTSSGDGFGTSLNSFDIGWDYAPAAIVPARSGAHGDSSASSRSTSSTTPSSGGSTNSSDDGAASGESGHGGPGSPQGAGTQPDSPPGPQSSNCSPHNALDSHGSGDENVSSGQSQSADARAAVNGNGPVPAADVSGIAPALGRGGSLAVDTELAHPFVLSFPVHLIGSVSTAQLRQQVTTTASGSGHLSLVNVGPFPTLGAPVSNSAAIASPLPPNAVWIENLIARAQAGGIADDEIASPAVQINWNVVPGVDEHGLLERSDPVLVVDSLTPTSTMVAAAAEQIDVPIALVSEAPMDTPTPGVPEPATMTLLAAAGLLAMQRRRR